MAVPLFTFLSPAFPVSTCRRLFLCFIFASNVITLSKRLVLFKHLDMESSTGKKVSHDFSLLWFKAVVYAVSSPACLTYG